LKGFVQQQQQQQQLQLQQQQQQQQQEHEQEHEQEQEKQQEQQQQQQQQQQLHLQRQLQQQRKQESAAVTLQRTFRGCATRRRIAYFRECHLEANGLIESVLEEVHSALCMTEAVVTLQSFCRGYAAREELQNLKKLDDAAIKIQTTFRARSARTLEMDRRGQRYLEEQAAPRLLCQSRVFIARSRILHEVSARRGRAAIVIQSWLRGELARKARALEVKRRQQLLVSRIQWQHRVFAARSTVLYERSAKQGRAATVIQSRFRGELARKTRDAELQRRKRHLASAVQCQHCVLVARLELLHKLAAKQDRAATHIQSRFRGELARRTRASLIERRKQHLASMVQCQHRISSARLELLHELAVKQNRAATLIQSNFRGELARQAVREKRELWRQAESSVLQALEGATDNYAATVVQKRWRRHLACDELSRRKARMMGVVVHLVCHRLLVHALEVSAQREEETMKLLTTWTCQRAIAASSKTAAIREQRKQELDNAATRIQSSIRGFQARRRFTAEMARIRSQEKQAATRLVKLACASHFRKEEIRQRQRFMKKMKATAAKKIQRIRRAQVVEKKEAERKDAAIRIQCNFRARKARIEAAHRRILQEEARHAAAVKIQAIQRRSQAQIEAAKLRYQKREEEKAAIRIQTVQRGKVARIELEKLMQEERRRQREKEAAIAIQRLHRGRVARKKVQTQRLELLYQENAAIKLQSVQRGRQARKQAQALRLEKQSQEQAAIKLQSTQRGRLGREQARARREQKRYEGHAAVKIQSLRRGKQARIQVAKQHRAETHAAMEIQRRHRAKKARGEVESLKAEYLKHCPGGKHMAPVSLLIHRWVTAGLAVATYREEEAIAFTAKRWSTELVAAVGQRLEEKEQQRCAATKIQAVHRGRIVRSTLAILHDQGEEEELESSIELLCSAPEAAIQAPAGASSQVLRPVQSFHRRRINQALATERARCEEQVALQLQILYRGWRAREQRHAALLSSRRPPVKPEVPGLPLSAPSPRKPPMPKPAKPGRRPVMAIKIPPAEEPSPWPPLRGSQSTARIPVAPTKPPPDSSRRRPRHMLTRPRYVISFPNESQAGTKSPFTINLSEAEKITWSTITAESVSSDEPMRKVHHGAQRRVGSWSHEWASQNAIPSKYRLAPAGQAPSGRATSAEKQSSEPHAPESQQGGPPASARSSSAERSKGCPVSVHLPPVRQQRLGVAPLASVLHSRPVSIGR